MAGTKKTSRAPKAKARKKTAKPVTLEAAIEAAEREHRELLAVDDQSSAHLRRVALAEARKWSLRADLSHRDGEHGAARKAATTANEAARHAERIAGNAVLDRVAALEAAMAKGRSLGSRLRELNTNQ